MRQSKKSKSLCVKICRTDSLRVFSVSRSSKLLIILGFLVLILHFISHSPLKSVPFNLLMLPESESCPNGLVYVYDLPAMFNQELLHNCNDLDPWESRCNAVSNSGLGPRATGLSGVAENLAQTWYWTDMFAGEVIYHSRILKHRCRTTKAESATTTALYIPFYAGLAVGKHLFTNSSTARERDMPGEKLLTWMKDQPAWRRSNGSDHFMMLGRMTWDFRRSRSRDDHWGSSFIHMPLMKHVLRLSIERDPWDPMEISVPYPTGFHPRSKSEIDQWMTFVSSHDRKNLFTFVGGKRNIEGDFRTVLFNQCSSETACRLVDCSGNRCHNGRSEIMAALLNSDFCLQPRGDTYTRRSIFDCMLAGSIPVFFWKRSVEKQYSWFLGDEPGRFSVFIDRRDVRNNGTSIRKVLEGYSEERVRKMRAQVVRTIPKLIYCEDEVEGVKDAFDIAIDGVLKRFKEMNNNNKDG